MIRALALCLLTALPAAAQDCTALAAAAGTAEGIPDGLMPAIALVESGHADGQGGRAPWPWALNAGGDSHFPADKEQALAKLDDILATGTTNVDLGCMQLNWRWHSAAFASAAEMIDPAANTAYAARFLHELHARLGSWELATAAYHSRDPDRGQAYLARVAAAQQGLAGAGGGAVLLASAVPVRLQGLLAVADTPLIAAAATRAALVLRAGAGDAAPSPSPSPSSSPSPPLLRGAARAPFSMAESTMPAFDPARLPRRLRAHRAEVLALRDTLAAAP